jgi:gamma-glutamyltranspeptidase
MEENPREADNRGAVADALVGTVHPPISGTANHTWRPGLMTLRDLKACAAPERAPTHLGYRGLDVYGMGPPSSGGSTVGEALNILEGYPLSTTGGRAAWVGPMGFPLGGGRWRGERAIPAALPA